MFGHTSPENRDKAKALARAAVLVDELETLAEALQRNGYSTAGVTANAWVADYLGFAQGFETFETYHYLPGDHINGTAFRLLDDLAEMGKPFFLYVHYMDPHSGYNPPEDHALFEGPLQNRAYPKKEIPRIAAYDGEIHFVDSRIGALFDQLRDRGLYDDAVIVLVSDHGEQFGEYGDHGHGKRVFNEEIHVPLILKAGNRRGEIDAVVSIADVFPTLLALTGTTPLHMVQGISLLDAETAERGGVFVEATRPVHHKAYVRRDRKKLILSFDAKRREVLDETKETKVVGLFDIDDDYLEKHSLDDPKLLAEMRTAFYATYRDSVARKGQGQERELTKETIEQLKALGYLQ